jgi:hypothetical protein
MLSAREEMLSRKHDLGEVVDHALSALLLGVASGCLYLTEASHV